MGDYSLMTVLLILLGVTALIAIPLTVVRSLASHEPLVQEAGARAAQLVYGQAKCSSFFEGSKGDDPDPEALPHEE